MIFREMSLSMGAMLGSTVDTYYASVLWWLRKYFALFLRCGGLESLSVLSPFGLNGERCPVDASGCCLALRGSHFETLDFFLRGSWVDLHDDRWVFSPLSAAFFGLLFGVEALPIRTSGLLTKNIPTEDLVKNNNNTVGYGQVGGRVIGLMMLVMILLFLLVVVSAQFLGLCKQFRLMMVFILELMIWVLFIMLEGFWMAGFLLVLVSYCRDGDLLLLIERMLHFRGFNTVRISKVKVRAGETMVRAGAVRESYRLGNNGPMRLLILVVGRCRGY